jgi:hypothetical protein
VNLTLVSRSSTCSNTSDPSLTFVDGTPGYINTPAAACRIADAFPSAKLIAVLRNPTEVSWASAPKPIQGKAGIE